MHEINSHSLSIKTKDLIGLSGPLELGTSVRIVIEGDVVEIKEIDRQDGTKDVIYLVKGLYGDYNG